MIIPKEELEENKEKVTEKEEVLVKPEDLINVESSGETIDFEEYDKKKVKIKGYTTIMVNKPFNEKGEYVKDLKKLIPHIKIETEEIFKIKSKEKGEISITASEVFALSKNKEGIWGVPLHPKANISKFLKDLKLPLGVEGLKQVEGKEVIVKVTEGKNGNKFLGFYY